MDIEPINLDGIDNIAEMRAMAAAFFQLASYAETRAEAMAFRQIGVIGSALDRENKCDSIYRKLPASLKW